MKDKILKIAGVKTEKQFYAKYPSEEAFMKVHGKAFKKAQLGAKIPKAFDGETILDPLTGLLKNSASTMKGLKTPSLQSVPGMPTSLGYNLSGDQNKQMFDLAGNALQGQSAQQLANGVADGAPGGAASSLSAAAPYIGAGVDILKSFDTFKQAKKKKFEAYQNRDVTKVQEQAAGTKDIDANNVNKQLAWRPPVISSGQLNSEGTNYTPLGRNGIMLQNGGPIGGNPTEIQNTYGIGNSIYDDLGYTSLPDNEIIKQYQNGGPLVPKSIWDPKGKISNIWNNQGGNQLARTASNAFLNQGQGPSGGSQLGKGLGTAAGTALFGPMGGKILGEVGGFVGDKLDNTGRLTDAANEEAHGSAMRTLINSQNMTSAYTRNGGKVSSYEDGGWMNPEYNPQVIAKFGDHSPEDIYHFAHEGMQSLRAGGTMGHPGYMQPSARALQTYEDGGNTALDGQVTTTWGGTPEEFSYNPVSAATGKMIKFNGASHDNGGIGVMYGEDNSPYSGYAQDGSQESDRDRTNVEVQGGEPGRETIDPATGEKTLSIYGKQVVSKELADQMNYSNYYGKTYQVVAKDIGKQQNKANKQLQKSIELANNAGTGKFGKLDLATANVMKKGAINKFENFDQQLNMLDETQTRNNEIAERLNIDASALSQGKIKPNKDAQNNTGKYGKNISKAVGGDALKLRPFSQTDWAPDVPAPERYNYPESNPAQFLNYGAVNEGTYGQVEGYDSPTNNPYASDNGTFTTPDFMPYASAASSAPLNNFVSKNKSNIVSKNKKGSTPKANASSTNGLNPLMTGIGDVIQYHRPPYRLPTEDYSPELAAASMNQLEAVKGFQSVQPQLYSPYKLSLSDQLASIDSSFAGAKRSASSNPALLAQIAAQESDAKNKVLGEQFRMNQAQEAQVYGKNIDLLNDAQVKNIAQYASYEEKQDLAKSNTKQQTLEILKSIADRRRKFQDEQTAANIKLRKSNYFVSPDTGIATYMGPLAQWNTQGGGPGSQGGGIEPGKEYLYNKRGQISGLKNLTKDEQEAANSNIYGKNGAKVKDKIKARNGSIVNALKNL